MEGAEISLRPITGSRLGPTRRDSPGSRCFPGFGANLLLLIEVDLDKKNDARINELLAGMLEIHGDPVADRRLHLSQAPGRAIGMTDIHAGYQLMAQRP